MDGLLRRFQALGKPQRGGARGISPTICMDILWVPTWTHDIQDLVGPLTLTPWHYEAFWNLDTSPGKGERNGTQILPLCNVGFR